jgi:hypothetical protein
MPSQELLEQMTAFNEELVKAGVMLGGEGLHPSARGSGCLPIRASTPLHQEDPTFRPAQGGQYFGHENVIGALLKVPRALSSKTA